MPLARIITDSVDDSLELTIQLRARGFQVETVAPNAVPKTPADLEVRLEECPPEEVLSRASQTPTQDDLWVFVAPGALDDRVRVIRELPVEPEPASESKATAPDQPPDLPKQQAAAPVIPFLPPEDDPILAELAEMRTAEATAQKQTVEAESPRAKAEVVVFPAASQQAVAVETDRRVATAPEMNLGVSADRVPAASENLPFWRIVTLAVGLAIVALLIGANLSQPSAVRRLDVSSAPIVSAASPPLPAPSSQIPQERARKVVSWQKLPAPATKPLVALQSATQLPKATSAASTKPRRQVTRSHSADVIAEDTVVFYDRKPPATGNVRTESGPKQPGRN